MNDFDKQLENDAQKTIKNRILEIQDNTIRNILTENHEIHIISKYQDNSKIMCDIR